MTYKPTDGEQKMLGDFNNRMSDMDRIAQSGGGLAILPDPNAAPPVTVASEAQNTLDDIVGNSALSGRQKARAAMTLNDGSGALDTSGIRGLSANQSAVLATDQFRAGSRLPADPLSGRSKAFADGGKVETPDELIARIQAKYGVSGTAPTPQPQAAPAPAPRTAPPAQQPGSMIQRAAGLLGGRAQQIDKAVNGFANGGELSDAQLAEVSVTALDRRHLGRHRQKQRAEIERNVARLGGKIKGPGTPTSDSIPATVADTGEQIRVSTGERILSKKQDDLLLRIAKAMGFESVNQLLEIGTGQPVGPTMKHGKKAAAQGATEETLHNGPYTGDGASLVNDFKGWQAGKIAETNAKIDLATGKTPSATYSNEGRSVPNPVSKAEQHPVSVPASRPGALLLGEQPVLPPNALVLTTKDIVPGGFSDRGAGIVASRGNGGQLNVTNVGTEGVADRATPIVDGSASALIDQKNSTYNPQRQLEAMQRLRMTSDATDPTIPDPAVRAQAQQGLLLLNAGRTGEAQANAQSAQAKLHTSQALSAEQMLGLHREYLDPATKPERRTELHGIIRALSGKEKEPANLQTVDVEEPIDPRQPLLGNRKIVHVFDPRTGNSRPMLQGNQQQGDATAQARAAIARGADPAKVNARLRAMNLPEVK